MKRFILVIGATVALAIGSVGSVAAHDPPALLAGLCPDGRVLTHETLVPGGGGPPGTKVLLRDVDRNLDGHACLVSPGPSDAKLLPVATIDKNVPIRKIIVKPL